MNNLSILGVNTKLPENRYSAEEVESAFMSWLGGQSKDIQLKGRRILRNADVQTRHSFLTLEEIFSPISLTQSTLRYREAMIELGTETLRVGLDRAGVHPQELDLLITTSCTGYMIPSVDAYMADRLGMRADLIRLPVTEMGCAAGASGLIYATQILTGMPGKKGAVVNIELPTNTMQHDDFSMDNIVGTALFSDGIACTVLGHTDDGGIATIRDCAMHQVPNTTEILGYQLTSNGLLMNLDVTLPGVIGEHFERASSDLLGRNGLSLGQLEHFVIHPGGIKILDQIQAILDQHNGSVDRSREVMRTLGNMSSATVIFILESLLNDSPKPGPALLMSFGPGFGAHQVLIDINTEANA